MLFFKKPILMLKEKEKLMGQAVLHYQKNFYIQQIFS